MDVLATNQINTIDVIGGVGGGGTVGVGVTLNALVIHNNAQAWIGGGANTRVSAAGDINVRASSDKTTKISCWQGRRVAPWRLAVISLC